jgi:type IV fimbrial biogenesis protein FimT
MLQRLFTIRGMSNRSTCISVSGRPSRRQGFTLVELMVTLVVVAVLMSIGAPGMQQFLLRRAVIAQADSLVSSIRFARSEALKGGQAVTVCNTADPNAATPACAAGNWASGWIIFVDRNSDQIFSPEDRLLQVQQAYGNSGGITATAPAVVTFNATGIAATGPMSFVARPAVLTASDANYEPYSRTVCVSRPGRARVVAGGACT